MTAIHNTLTGTTTIRQLPTIAGQPHPLPEHYVLLQVVQADPPEYNPAAENLSSEWIVDLQTATYTKVWTVTDKTEAEQTDYINQQAQQVEENRKELARQRVEQNEIEVINTEAEALPDEDALDNMNLFPAYVIGKDYILNERFMYPLDGKLYKVLQPHTSAIQWKPDEAESLYVAVTPPGVIADWVQPAGAHDAYMQGDIVTHNGQTWISNVDNNVWEPGVYGWSVHN